MNIVIALCLFINGQLVEHRLQTSLSDCLKHKRELTRNLEMNNKEARCGEMEVELVKNADGTLAIGKIIQSK
jgi:hypothetical protein